MLYVENKKNCVTYVYESINYWDKEKKQPRSKRVCIGKLDKDRNIIPSKRLCQPSVKKLFLIVIKPPCLALLGITINDSDGLVERNQS